MWEITNNSQSQLKIHAQHIRLNSTTIYWLSNQSVYLILLVSGVWWGALPLVDVFFGCSHPVTDPQPAAHRASSCQVNTQNGPLAQLLNLSLFVQMRRQLLVFWVWGAELCGSTYPLCNKISTKFNNFHGSTHQRGVETPSSYGSASMSAITLKTITSSNDEPNYLFKYAIAISYSLSAWPHG